jgi:HEPN domain-containing protein
VNKAEGDYDAVCILRRSRKRSRFDSSCFHCQQCAEKYLKGRLNQAGLQFSKTHDLAALLKQLSAVEPLWMGMELALRNLTNSAVAVRYPGVLSDSTAAAEAFKTCQRPRKLARASLGLH